MSEYRTTKYYAENDLKGVRNSDIQAFGTTPQVSEIQTDHPTIIQHLNDIINALQVDMGVGILKIAFKCCLMLCNYPFLFQCLKFKL